MARHTMLIVMIVGVGVLSAGHVLCADPKKVRTDLTGRGNLTPEEVITGLTPQTTRGLQPGLSTIAVTIHFAFDSAEISPQAVPNLQSLGHALASPQLAPYQIRIEGHTDNTGPAVYNLGLSRRRAHSVKQYLVQHFAIRADRLLTEGRGEDEPLAPNDTREGRGKNRRAEFVNMSPTVSSQ